MKKLSMVLLMLLVALPMAAQSPERSAAAAPQAGQAQGAQNPEAQKKATQGVPGQPPQGGEKLTSENVEEMVKGELETGDTAYRYDAKGRRDPFRSLLIANTISGPTDCRKGTPECILWDDITLQGIWKVKGVIVSQILAKNADVYWIKESEALFDGMVTKITMDCVYFKQKVNDPTKINPFRDVEKCLLPEATK